MKDAGTHDGTELIDHPIDVRNLSFRVGWRKTIIKDISLVLAKNEFVGLIGGSGSGKTTLLTCLNGFRRPTEGRVRINGMRGDDPSVRPLVGYVPQEDLVHGTLSIERALHYACLLRLASDTPPEKIEYRVGKVLHQLDLRDHRHKKIRSLSGGQRKRVNIGLELLHSPRLFFLDEPTAGLDPGLEGQLMRLMAALARQGRVVVMTTHLMQHAHLFDILIFIHKGQMAYFGPSEAITDFFKVSHIVDLFESVAAQPPELLHKRYYHSDIFRRFLMPRMKPVAHVA